MALILRDRVACDLDLATAGETHLGRIASRFCGQAQDVVIASFEFAGSDCDEVGEPGIAVLRCAFLGSAALAADPDGDARLLYRFGKEGKVLEAIELPLEACVLFPPQSLDNLK